MEIRTIIFEIIYTVLAFLLLLNGDYEMSVLAVILGKLTRIEDKLERKR